MPLYELTDAAIRTIPSTAFATAKVRERADLQRLLRDAPGLLLASTDEDESDLLILAEEFGEFEDSRRRIDLLGVDRAGNLVVIELKRTDDGGHMELQALRYAAMVSAMTWRRAVEHYATFLARTGRGDEDAEQNLLDFLDWDEPRESDFARRVRILLASADFGRELTTAVLWLNDQGLDITCVQLRPHDLEGRLILDIRQVIPLPEAAEYQIKLKEKAAEERSDRGSNDQRASAYREFYTQLLSVAPSDDVHNQMRGRRLDRPGLGGNNFYYFIGPRTTPYVCLYKGAKTAAEADAQFQTLKMHRGKIEQAFGGSLFWQLRDGKRSFRIQHDLPRGTIDDAKTWPDLQSHMIDAMVRLEAALRPHLESLEA